MMVAKQAEWDMGHRLTNHSSKCRNLHGHHYKLEVCLEGDVVTKKGASEEGMVIDFGEIKSAIQKHIFDVLDHSFMVWEKDELLVKFFKENSELKHLLVPFVTTSENIAAWIFIQLDKIFKEKYKAKFELYSVKLWETPTSFSICDRQDIKNILWRKK
jgi:6-pyruvoyltetrahydropterin/6-carboxytetrahydropterin synthase